MTFIGSLWTDAQRYTPLLLRGAVVTVEITLGAFCIALVLGLVVALCRLAPWPPLRAVGTAYVELLRAIPPITWLFIFYFGLSSIGFAFPALAVAIYLVMSWPLGQLAQRLERRVPAPSG